MSCTFLNFAVPLSLSSVKPVVLISISVLSEIGSDQEQFSLEMLREAGFQTVEVLRDYAGLPRVAKGIK